MVSRGGRPRGLHGTVLPHVLSSHENVMRNGSAAFARLASAHAALTRGAFACRSVACRTVAFGTFACRTIACAAALSLAACSSDATPYVPDPSTEQQPASPSGPNTPGPSVLSSGGDTLGASEAPASGAPGQSPGSVPPAGSPEPEPNATETNFFTAGCRVDADCGAARRCEFFPPESAASDAGPPDTGADGGQSNTRPVAPPALPSDAGLLPDAGVPGAPDAAPSEPLGPRGRCVARAR